MADTTTHKEKMTRQETADYLRSIAQELESGRNRVRVPVGNKRIGLSPPDKVSAEVTVTERSRRVRKDIEELELSFDWNPTRAVDEEEEEPDEQTVDEEEE